MARSSEAGKIAELNKVARYLTKYKRTNLTQHIPQDSSGELLSPQQAVMHKILQVWE